MGVFISTTCNVNISCDMGFSLPKEARKKSQKLSCEKDFDFWDCFERVKKNLILIYTRDYLRNFSVRYSRNGHCIYDSHKLFTVFAICKLLWKKVNIP